MDAVVDNTGEVLKSEEVLWIPQTVRPAGVLHVLSPRPSLADARLPSHPLRPQIGNACGTMGLLHALANSGLAPPDRSPFAQFLAAARALPRAERTRLLEQTELFADAHVDASSAGQSLLRDEDAHTNLHFTTFVQATLCVFCAILSRSTPRWPLRKVGTTRQADHTPFPSVDDLQVRRPAAPDRAERQPRRADRPRADVRRPAQRACPPYPSSPPPVAD